MIYVHSCHCAKEASKTYQLIINSFSQKFVMSFIKSFVTLKNKSFVKWYYRNNKNKACDLNEKYICSIWSDCHSNLFPIRGGNSSILLTYWCLEWNSWTSRCFIECVHGIQLYFVITVWQQVREDNLVCLSWPLTSPDWNWHFLQCWIFEPCQPILELMKRDVKSK